MLISVIKSYRSKVLYQKKKKVSSYTFTCCTDPITNCCLIMNFIFQDQCFVSLAFWIALCSWLALQMDFLTYCPSFYFSIETSTDDGSPRKKLNQSNDSSNIDLLPPDGGGVAQSMPWMSGIATYRDSTSVRPVSLLLLVRNTAFAETLGLSSSVYVATSYDMLCLVDGDFSIHDNILRCGCGLIQKKILI